MLSGSRPILLANARIVDPALDLDGPGDVLITDGVVRDARHGIGAAGVPEGTDIIDCAGKIVAPGLIDIRAFVGEPGAGHRETFASASRAAVEVMPEVPSHLPLTTPPAEPRPAMSWARTWATLPLRTTIAFASMSSWPSAAIEGVSVTSTFPLPGISACSSAGIVLR